MKNFFILFISLFVSFSALAEDNASVERPFSLGIGFFSTDVYVESFSTYNDDSFSGVALSFGYATSNNLAFNATFFSLENDRLSSIESNGYELLAYYGEGFLSTGFKAYIGGGVFSDKWKVGNISTTRDGLQLSGGVGHNWNSVSIDFVIGVRDASDYEMFVRNSLPVPINVSAVVITTMLSVSARF